jgi:hypothetical protein
MGAGLEFLRLFLAGQRGNDATAFKDVYQYLDEA